MLVLLASSAAWRAAPTIFGDRKACSARAAPTMAVGDRKEPKSNTFVSLRQTFALAADARPPPAVERFLESARTAPRCLYCGWSRSGETLVLEEAFADADAPTAHWNAARPELDALTALSAPELHGPTAEIARCAVDATLYALDANAFSNFARDTDGHMTGLRACSLQQRFAVSEWAAAAPIMAAIVEAAKRERGVIHFGWARSNDRLFLRAAHQNEAAILRHIDGVAPLVAQLTAGPAALESTELHATTAQLNGCRSAVEDAYAGARCFARCGGFSRYEAWEGDFEGWKSNVRFS